MAYSQVMKEAEKIKIFSSKNIDFELNKFDKHVIYILIIIDSGRG